VPRKRELLPGPVISGTNATALVARHHPGDIVDWRAVDVASVRESPELVSQVDPEGQYNGGEQYSGLPIWMSAPISIWRCVTSCTVRSSTPSRPSGLQGPRRGCSPRRWRPRDHCTIDRSRHRQMSAVTRGRLARIATR
jgi:hypothetical protein